EPGHHPSRAAVPYIGDDECVGRLVQRAELLRLSRLGHGHRVPPFIAATTDDNLLPFGFPAVECKKVTAAFDGGRLSSDGGVMLLSQAERRLGLAERLAAVIPDDRD